MNPLRREQVGVYSPARAPFRYVAPRDPARSLVWFLHTVLNSSCAAFCVTGEAIFSYGVIS